MRLSEHVHNHYDFNQFLTFMYYASEERTKKAHCPLVKRERGEKDINCHEHET